MSMRRSCGRGRVTRQRVSLLSLSELSASLKLSLLNNPLRTTRTNLTTEPSYVAVEDGPWIRFHLCLLRDLVLCKELATSFFICPGLTGPCIPGSKQ